MERYAELHRETKETEVSVTLSLDGGESKISTGVGFFDHMLTALAVHGGLGLTVKTVGDWAVDCHHTIEDTGIVLGQAFRAALGNKQGICRYGSAFIPMDEALAFLEGGEKQPAEYAAVNARLLAQLGLLVEAELPTLTNIL